MRAEQPRAVFVLLAACAALALLVAPTVRAEVMLDGEPAVLELVDLPANTGTDPGGRPIDTVGSTANVGSGVGRAKGNAYRVDIGVTLSEMEFYLNFTSAQTLTYYVFTCPVEFGLYTEVYRRSETVTGAGAGWYSSGPIAVNLSAGNHYIVAVSWNGSMSYYYGTGDSQATSFGAHVHGYATGYDPLPASFESLVNDQAIYHQRLTTGAPTPAAETTWGAIRALYRDAP